MSRSHAAPYVSMAMDKVNVKRVKFTVQRATKAQRGSRGIAPLLTSALDGVCGQLHAPAALLSEKARYTLPRRPDGPQGPSGRVRKISPPPEFDPRIVQPVPSRSQLIQ